MKKYLLNNLISWDQALNTLLGGYPDETISSRAWRCRDSNWFWGYARKAIDAGFFWQQQHCRASYLAEKRRKHTHSDFY